MRATPTTSAVGSSMYAILCTRPNICFVVGMGSKYQSNPGLLHWIASKHILEYLWRVRDYLIVPEWGFGSHWLHIF
jgi:hypothetical protein